MPLVGSGVCASLDGYPQAPQYLVQGQPGRFLALPPREQGTANTATYTAGPGKGSPLEQYIPSWESGLRGPGTAPLARLQRCPPPACSHQHLGLLWPWASTRPSEATTAHQQLDPGRQPPALVCTESPGLCLPGSLAPRAGRRKGGVWVGGGGERLRLRGWRSDEGTDSGAGQRDARPGE